MAKDHGSSVKNDKQYEVCASRGSEESSGKKSTMENEGDQHSEGSAVISREVVGVLKQLVGRGPTKSKAYLHADCVVLLLREGHTTSEETMFKAGSGRTVAQGRVVLSETIRQPLIEVIERNTNRKVVGFMSSSQQHPDLICFVFVLDTSPLLG